MRVDKPLVSVIIPTYERPMLLGQAVDSVLTQTHENLEIIVVEDGQNANAAAILDGLSVPSTARLRCLRHDEQRGANAARNTGIDAANGEYIAFLDDDDRWRPTKIERQLEDLVGASDDVGISFTGQVVLDADAKPTNVVEPATTGRFLDRLVDGATLGTFSTVLVRRDVIDATGRPDERMPCWQDREWFMTVSRRYDFVATTDPLTVRQVTDSPRISDDYPAFRDVARPLMEENHREYVAGLGDDYERRLLATLSRSVGIVALASDEYTEAVQYLLRSLRYRPTDSTAYPYLLAAIGGRHAARMARGVKRRYNRVRYDS